MKELKQCPFCGGKAQLVKWCINEEAFSPFYLVDCSVCGIGTPKYCNANNAVRLWNGRKK